MAWHVNLGIILTQQENLKDLDGLFDTSGTNLNLGAKLRDEFTILPSSSSRLPEPSSQHHHHGNTQSSPW